MPNDYSLEDCEEREYEDPNTPPFKPGDLIELIMDYREFKKGQQFTAKDFSKPEDSWLVDVEGSRGAIFCKRFKLVMKKKESSLTAIQYKKKGYVIVTETTPPRSKDVASLYSELYKFRKVAALSYKFNTGPATKIHTIREAIRSKAPETVKYLYNCRYNVKVTLNSCYKDSLELYKSLIRTARIALKTISAPPSPTGFYTSECIHVKPNGIFNLYAKKVLIPAKYPTSPAPHIGVEIELGLPKDCDWALLVPFKDKISVGDDGSIKGLPLNYMSKEVRVLTTVTNYKKDLSAICEALARMNALVNDSCGLHVHLDMRNISPDIVKSRFINLVKSQKYLQGMVKEDRRLNQFCKPTRHLDPYQRSSTRYHAINSEALNKYNTLEIRMHHGSIDAIEITNWIKLLLTIVKADPITRASPTLKSFMEKINISETLKEYVDQKIKLNSPVIPETVPDTDSPTQPCNEAITWPTSRGCGITHSDNDRCLNCRETWQYHAAHTCRRGLGNGRFEVCVIPQTANPETGLPAPCSIYSTSIDWNQSSIVNSGLGTALGAIRSALPEGGLR